MQEFESYVGELWKRVICRIVKKLKLGRNNEDFNLKLLVLDILWIDLSLSANILVIENYFGLTIANKQQ